MSAKLIRGVIDFETPSEEAICLHEAGHACAALVVGLVPDLLEFTDDPSCPGVARNSIPVGSAEQRKFIACGAYAVELNLFQANRLTDKKGNPISEKTFIHIAVGLNAAEDKQKYFGRNLEQNGSWPADYDRTFMTFGAKIAPKLPMNLVIALAEALLNERRVGCERVIEIAKLHLSVGVTDHLKCERQDVFTVRKPMWRKVLDWIKLLRIG